MYSQKSHRYGYGKAGTPCSTVISPILSPGLINPTAEIGVCAGAVVGEIWVEVAHAVMISANSAMIVKQASFFMGTLLFVREADLTDVRFEFSAERQIKHVINPTKSLYRKVYPITTDSTDSC
jgi:hypothetical protein